MRWSSLRRDAGPTRERPRGIIAIVAGLSLATATLVWLAWTATNEMQRSTNVALERRASEVLALASAALNRDMKGAWLSVLTPMEAGALEEDPPYDLLQLTSRAFARFPYPESFIVWTAGTSSSGRTFAFNRSDRAIAWHSRDSSAEPYPVTLVRDPEAIAPLVTRVLDAGRARRRFAIVDISIGGVPYQVVAHLMFASVDRPRVTAFVALMVNLQWVRQDYLGELLRQVATIDGESDAMAIAVLDEQRTVVATSGVTSSEPQVRERAFPLLFFEPALVSALPEPRPVVRMWTAQVRPAPGANAAASTLGARMLLLSSLAGAASLVAVLLTVRAVRVSAELATMKSDFVSAVTHELKTPVALIALVGETLERGRYTSEDTIRDYAAILSQEARRLNHLIENLLTYSRLSDMASVYSFEPVELNELVEDALTPFRPRMTDLGFELDVRIEADLAPVLADRAAMVRVFANVIDNALKYSTDGRSLIIAAVREAHHARISFTDRGVGIPADELPYVFEKFYRVQRTSEFGSGLGLAIVRRIVNDHGGVATIRSVVGTGTTVTITLPLAQRT